MKRLLLILLIGILFNSCIGLSSYNEIKYDNFYIKIDKQPNNIDSLLNIKGYYVQNMNNKDGTNYTSYFMLFADGSYVNQIYFDLDSMSKIKNISFGIYQGFYKLYGDTIKIQMIDRGYGLTASDFSEKWYKLIDRNTLKLIYFDEYDLTKYSLSTFSPLDILPPFDCYLKKDKFFWKDEKDWKDYMKTRMK